MEEEFKKITYTTILHQAREKLKITTNEYCVADIIYHLSNNPKSKVQGWCYASKKTIGKFIGITKQSALAIIERLENKKIVQKDEETKYLKTTEKWFNTVVLGRLKMLGKETLPVVKKTAKGGKESIPTGGKETLPYNNTLDTNKDNKSAKTSFASIFSAYKEKINSKSLLTKLAEKKIASALKSFSEKDLLEMIAKKGGDDWFLKNNASRGISWFFSSKERLNCYLEETKVSENNEIEL